MSMPRYTAMASIDSSSTGGRLRTNAAANIDLPEAVGPTMASRAQYPSFFPLAIPCACHSGGDHRDALAACRAGLHRHEFAEQVVRPGAADVHVREAARARRRGR